MFNPIRADSFGMTCTYWSLDLYEGHCQLYSDDYSSVTKSADPGFMAGTLGCSSIMK